MEISLDELTIISLLCVTLSRYRNFYKTRDVTSNPIMAIPPLEIVFSDGAALRFSNNSESLLKHGFATVVFGTVAVSTTVTTSVTLIVKFRPLKSINNKLI